MNDFWLHALLRDFLHNAKRIKERTNRPPVVSVTPIRYVDNAFGHTVPATPPLDELEYELQTSCAV